MKKLLFTICIAAILLAGTACTSKEDQITQARYESAINAYEEGRYLDAKILFERCDGYKNSEDWYKKCTQKINSKPEYDKDGIATNILKDDDAKADTAKEDTSSGSGGFSNIPRPEKEKKEDSPGGTAGGIKRYEGDTITYSGSESDSKRDTDSKKDRDKTWKEKMEERERLDEENEYEDEDWEDEYEDYEEFLEDY